MNRLDLIEKLKQDRKEIYYYSGSVDRHIENKKFNKTEFLAKKLRHNWIQGGDINTHKHVIPIKRLRDRKDTMFGLLKNKEIAAVIEGREEFPALDFVLDKGLSSRLER